MLNLLTWTLQYCIPAAANKPGVKAQEKHAKAQVLFRGSTPTEHSQIVHALQFQIKKQNNFLKQLKRYQVVLMS